MLRLIDLPKSVDGLMAKDVYEKARAYALDKNSFGIVEDIYSKIFNTVRITYKNILINYMCSFYYNQGKFYNIY